MTSMTKSSAMVITDHGTNISSFSRLQETENGYATVSSGCCSQEDINILSENGRRCQMVKILLLTLVPILILSGITLVGVIENTPDYAVKSAIQNGIHTSLEVGSIIHRLQIERGVSVTYLSSNGDSVVYDMLLSVYVLTDKAIEEVPVWPSNNDISTYFKSKLAYSKRILKFRELVMNNNVTLFRVIELYSELNAVIIEWIAGVVNLALTGQLSRSMIAYHMLLLAKDETGVERAIGSSFFEKGNFSNDELVVYVEKKFSASTYTALSMTYSSLVSSMIKDRFTGSELHIRITEMRQHIIDNDISNHSSLNWFANMTSYINILKDVQDTMATKILSALKTELESNYKDYYISIGLMVGAVILYPLILVVVFKLTNKIQLVAISLSAQTALLRKERKRSEALLCEMLPTTVAKKLMANEKVEPRMYKCATVFFSDIVGFTTICSGCTPLEVVDFLNMLYNTFDSKLEEYDVYKVETIGDAYMVVSGIPELNGDRHAKEISLMALAILDACSEVEVPHLSRENIGLQVRIGINTGPVVSGIVGIKMPRYCLFGDTVNVAARMESTGQPQKIQISEATATALKKYDGFQTQRRGMIEIKGKGKMLTFWLERSIRITSPGYMFNMQSALPIVVVE
ncbi:uncharacterized protein LOC132561594 [Ylistrum balloti]|uniref:uncharacterized protein LOC132561594 n=1 Tax=Ylistrum balloti TaxID=509963 RepID=UPI002905E4E1|nr:uncharacterized protein LOC132561594 [Ylistrum balloti]